MKWFTDYVRPKLDALVGKKEVPDNLWVKCSSCEQMLFNKDLEANLYVCRHCDHHLKFPVRVRLADMFDDGEFNELTIPKVQMDPLKFKDSKKYPDRLKAARQKTGNDDAIVVAEGHIGGHLVVIAAFDFDFIGGSMGMAVGEGLVTGAEHAARKKAAFITIPASGGARMQEGILSLMQMPRSIFAIEQVKDAGLPYLVLLTHPTTGGVSACLAMIGDVHLAEPGAVIGFTGARVIQETIRTTLPEGFQSAEFQQKHGMVDLVVHRKDVREKVTTILDTLLANFH